MQTSIILVMENKMHPNYIIDEQFLDALKPLISTQKFLLFPKFTTTERHITKLKKLCTKSPIGLLCFLLMRVYRTMCLMEIFVHIYIGVNSIILVLLNTSHGFIGTICSYIVNIAQSENSIKLLLELQSVLQSINSEKLKLLADQKLWNYINVVCLVFGHIIYTILIGIVNQEDFSDGSFLVSYSVSIIFDLNMILATRSVNMIGSMLAVWKRKMISQLVIEDEDCIKVMFFSYQRMIKAFRICKNVYQFAIFYHTCQTFHHVLHSVQLLLEFAKTVTKENSKIFGVLRGLVYFLWNCKNFTLIINLSVACERFYSCISEIEATCAQSLACEESDLRKTCKNVLRLNSSSLRRLSPFGLFAVDATFPLRLIGALVPYIVVLLQFALL